MIKILLMGFSSMLFAPSKIEQSDKSSCSSSSSQNSDQAHPLMSKEEFEKVAEHIRNAWFSWYGQEEHSIFITIGWDVYKVDELSIINTKTKVLYETVEDFFSIVVRNQSKAIEGQEWKPK